MSWRRRRWAKRVEIDTEAMRPAVNLFAMSAERLRGGRHVATVPHERVDERVLECAIARIDRRRHLIAPVLDGRAAARRRDLLREVLDPERAAVAAGERNRQRTFELANVAGPRIGEQRPGRRWGQARTAGGIEAP